MIVSVKTNLASQTTAQAEAHLATRMTLAAVVSHFPATTKTEIIIRIRESTQKTTIKEIATLTTYESSGVAKLTWMRGTS